MKNGRSLPEAVPAIIYALNIISTRGSEQA